jgi:hypothetical protein
MKHGLKLAMMCLGSAGLVWTRQAAATPTLTVSAGVHNPALSLQSTGLNPAEYAVSDTVGLVPVANFEGVLQATLNAQGFTPANNWSLVTNSVTLSSNAVYNLSTYTLALNSAGTGFGENIQFALNADPASPTVPAGSTPTLHWLQYINTSAKVNGYGFTIPDESGYWQVDNGQINGAAASGAATGPYYDSNADGETFSTPPSFYDFPQYYSGIGTYLHFDVVPVWDIYNPASNGSPASEDIDVANYAVSWGFTIEAVPEPRAPALVMIAASALTVRRRRVH